jgi:beta-glucosidase
VRDVVGDVDRPVRELKGIQRVAIAAGETKRVTFRLSTDDLSFYNQKMELVTEPGEFQVWVGGNSDAELATKFEIQ